MSTRRDLRPSSTCAARCPSGVTVLEASAGTGKTYTIAALAARYVAEGTPLERLLLITFTRMATGELRDRVRERLVVCEQQLSRILAGAPDHGRRRRRHAAGHRHRPTGRSVRRDRLARAVADFDAATIATTHGFCQEVLAELGTVGDLDRETVFVEDVSDLLEEVARRSVRPPLSPPRAARRSIAAEALADRAGRGVQPDGGARAPRASPTDSTAAMRYRLAGAVRDELEQRKRRHGDHDLRRSAHAAEPDTLSGAERPGGDANGCAPVTTWCWSTSSRTPIRSSGRSSTVRSRLGA